MVKGRKDVAKFHRLLSEEHGLGDRPPAGDTLRQAVVRGDGEWVALLLWGAAALRLKARDAFIGWDAAKRSSRLKLVAQNSRFLVVESTREPMARPDRPTALVSFSNEMSIGAMLAIKESGLRVPDDVSLVGVDDFYFAGLLDPPPTVIRVPIHEMAERSIRLLLEEIESKRPPMGKFEVFQPELVERASCRRIG